MPKKIRCYCKGNPGCVLCKGAGKYVYTPGPQGWQPFTCPQCNGTGKLHERSEARCFTCDGHGKIDPADPPSGGLWDDLCKILFGA